MQMRRIANVQLTYLLIPVVWFIFVPLPFERGGRKPVCISEEYQKFT